MSLLEAVHRMDVDRAAALLFRGADVNVRDGPRGVTPLLIACHRGEVRMVDLLLQAKASTKLSTIDTQSSCLHIAAKNNSAGIVRSLLKADPGIEERPTWQGDTALMVACLSAVETEASAETLSALLQPLQSNTDVGDKSKNHIAGSNGGDSGRRAGGSHRRRLESEEAAYLGPDDPRLRARNRHGHTALHCAAFGQSQTAVRKLLEAGADVTATDKAGRTAVKIALEKVDKEKQAASATAAAAFVGIRESLGVGGIDKDRVNGLGRGGGVAAATECLKLLQDRWAELEKESKERELRLLGELEDGLGEVPGAAGKSRRRGNANGGIGKRSTGGKKKKKLKGEVPVSADSGSDRAIVEEENKGETAAKEPAAAAASLGADGERGLDGGAATDVQVADVVESRATIKTGGEVVGSSSEGEGETDDEVRSHPSSEAEVASHRDPVEQVVSEPRVEAETADVDMEGEYGTRGEIDSKARADSSLERNGGSRVMADDAATASMYGDGGSWSVVARPARRKRSTAPAQSSSYGGARDVPYGRRGPASWQHGGRAQANGSTDAGSRTGYGGGSRRGSVNSSGRGTYGTRANGTVGSPTQRPRAGLGGAAKVTHRFPPRNDSSTARSASDAATKSPQEEPVKLRAPNATPSLASGAAGNERPVMVPRTTPPAQAVVTMSDNQLTVPAEERAAAAVAGDAKGVDVTGEGREADGNDSEEQTTVAPRRQLNANASVWTPSRSETMSSSPVYQAPHSHPLPPAGHQPQHIPVQTLPPPLQQHQMHMHMSPAPAGAPGAPHPLAPPQQQHSPFPGNMPTGVGPAFCIPMHGPPPPPHMPQHQHQPAGWAHQPPMGMVGVTGIDNGGVAPPPMAANVGFSAPIVPVSGLSSPPLPQYPVQQQCHPNEISAGTAPVNGAGTSPPEPQPISGSSDAVSVDDTTVTESGAPSLSSPATPAKADGMRGASPLPVVDAAQTMLESSSPQAAAVALQVEHLVWSVEQMRAGLSMGQLDMLKSVLLDQVTRVDEAKLEHVRVQERSKNEEEANMIQLKHVQAELETKASVDADESTSEEAVSVDDTTTSNTSSGASGVVESSSSVPPTSTEVGGDA